MLTALFSSEILLVQLLKKKSFFWLFEQILNAEEEIRMRTMQASLRTTVPQPSENAADGSSISRLVPRMTVDVNFSDVAGESEAGSNQGTPGRPLHHVHSISPSTASFARSPFGSLQHNSVSNCRSIFFSKHCRSIIWSLCLHLSVGHQCKSETIEDNYVSEFSRIIWVIHNLFLFIFCFGFRYSVVSVR